MKAIIWGLNRTIQDSEALAIEGNKYGFRHVLERDAMEHEFFHQHGCERVLKLD